MKKTSLIFCLFTLISVNKLISQSSTCFQIPFGVTGWGPRSIASGDFDKDGKLDLVTANESSSTISVFFGHGDGKFNTAINYSVTGSPTVVSAADFNGDGNIDIATANNSNYVSVMLNNGTGSFSVTNNYLAGPPPYGLTPVAMASNDFNGDGKPDLATVNENLSTYTGGDVSVFINNGSGSFLSAVNYQAGSEPLKLLSTDFNNDGKADLAVLTLTSSLPNISILIGSGTGTFSAAVNYPLSGNIYTLQGHDIISADFNEDGNMDVIVAGTDLHVFFGDGTGSITESAVTYPSGNAFFISSGDYNGDGYMDILDIISSGVNNSTLLLGTGSGTFVSPTNFPNSQNVTSVISKDFNGDGRTDVALTEGSYSHLTILLADANGRLESVIGYSTGINPYGATSSDFDGDGKPDVAICNYQYASTSGISIFKNNGDGTMLPGLNIPCDPFPIYIATCDFNADGKKDLITSNSNSGIYSVSLLLGNGNATFSTPISYSISANAQNIICNDFNNDGITDFAVPVGSHISVFSGNTAGSLIMSGNYSIGSASPVYIASCDVNSDGKIDLLAAGTNSNVTVLLGNGGGMFGAPINYSVPYDVTMIACGDLNGDSKPDIVALNSDLLNHIYNKSVLINNGSGSFLSPINSPVTGVSNMISIEDMNGDGKMDILISSDDHPNLANINTHYISIGDGTGNFSGTIMYKLPARVDFAIPADVNGDGLKDIINVHGWDDIMTILINQAAHINIGAANSICHPGDQVLLKGTLGAFSYNWQPGGNTSDSISVGTTGVYTLTTNNLDNTCVSTATINVGSAPALLYSSGTQSFSICSGSSAVISVSGANTYTWSTGATTSSISASALTTTIYTVSGTDLNGCTAISNATLTVNPTPTITVNSGVICAGQIFTINPSGAGTYTYSSGSSTVATVSNTSYTVTGTGSNGCIDNVGAVGTITVNATPVINVSSNPTVCIGSTTGILASGANTYSWSTGAATSSISVNPTTTTTYTITGTDLNNCSNTQTVSVTVDPTCADVWPGDANSDGVADNTDILELGLHYTQTGPGRTSISNAWQSYHANNWTGTITNGQNVNHSDCNGDGTIDANDTLAIYNNYGLVHAFKPSNTATVNPQLSIVPDQGMVDKGQWGTSSIYLGDASDPISNINGLAFTVDFDKTLIEPNSIYLEYPTSFINASNQNLHFRKLDFSNGLIYTATTHTTNTNVSGNGKIAILHYRIKATLTHDTVLNIGLIQATQSNASGILTPLTTGAATLMAIGATVGIDELTGDHSTAVYPNPASNVLMVTSSQDLQKLELTGMTGQVILSEGASGKQHQVQLSGLAAGIYMVNVYSSGRIIKRSKIVVQR